MNQQQQYEYIKATARPARRVLIKEVLGGFSLTGQVAYHDRGNNGVLMEVTHEGVAPDGETASMMVTNFMLFNQFDGTPVPDPLPLFDSVETATTTPTADAVTLEEPTPVAKLEVPPTPAPVEAVMPDAPPPIRTYSEEEVAAMQAAHEEALAAAMAGQPNVAVSETDGSKVI